MHKRLSISLTEETAGRIDRVCSFLGISKSALLEQLLSVATGDMCRVLDALPEKAEDLSQGDLLRFRGGSVAVLQNRVASLRGLINDM